MLQGKCPNFHSCYINNQTPMLTSCLLVSVFFIENFTDANKRGKKQNYNAWSSYNLLYSSSRFFLCTAHVLSWCNSMAIRFWRALASLIFSGDNWMNVLLSFFFFFGGMTTKGL